MPARSTLADKAYGSRLLERGMTGRDVWELQIKLIGWGSGTANDGIGSFMDPVRVTGTLDSTTADAVKRFQKAHDLPVTGVVDALTFWNIDCEPGRHPVVWNELKCPCAAGSNAGPILCRCTKHDEDSKGKECTGFGKKRFAGKFLLDDDNDLKGEKLDLYDKEEYEGVDKAVVWALRALMHRATVPGIQVVSGYRCWWDNYHHTDDTRWYHRRTTLYLGKSIAFIQPGTCTTEGDVACARCEVVRTAALEKCGFQLRWHEKNRVSVAEGGLKARVPSTPFAVHVDSVRRLDREKDEFVQTDEKAREPLYPGKIGVSLPTDLDGSGLDPRRASSEAFFANFEATTAGWFPLGKDRRWHGGVHLHLGSDKIIRAMGDGEVIGCRVGAADDAAPHGTLNFVLLRHAYKDKTWFSLTMHLDKEGATKDSKTRWRKELYLRSVKHVKADVSAPIYIHSGIGTASKLTPKDGLLLGERAAITADAAVDPTTLDAKAPKSSLVVKLADVANAYVYTKRDNVAVATVVDADAGLKDKLDNKEIIGLADDKTFKLYAGEPIGSPGPAPSHSSLSSAGTYVHLETFSKDNLLSASGYTLVDVASADDALDRQKAVKALVDKKLLAEPTDGVLLPAEADDFLIGPARDRLRSVVVKMPSLWSLKYEDVIDGHAAWKWLATDKRKVLGKAFDAYGFWKAVTDGGGVLPSAAAIHHFHPMALLLHIAHDETRGE
jgi:peptidoglycan hydrolase-like protein with peptidoglycan-binding domain